MRPDDPEKKTSGGIIIPDMAVGKPMTGTVALTGKQSEDDIPLSEGDRVTYLVGAGIEITLDGVSYLLMKKTEILMVE